MVLFSCETMLYSILFVGHTQKRQCNLHLDQTQRLIQSSGYAIIINDVQALQLHCPRQTTSPSLLFLVIKYCMFSPPTASFDCWTTCLLYSKHQSNDCVSYFSLSQLDESLLGGLGVLHEIVQVNASACSVLLHPFSACPTYKMFQRTATGRATPCRHHQGFFPQRPESVLHCFHRYVGRRLQEHELWRL